MLEDPYAYVVAAFQAPPLPDYMRGSEEPEQTPPLLEFVLEPSDLEEDPEEDPTDYPADEGDDDDDDDESSDDDEDDDDDYIPSPLLPVSPPLPVSSPPLPASLTYPLGYRAAMIRLRAETPSTSHPLPSGTPPLGTQPILTIPLTTLSPPLILPSTSPRADVLEVTLPPRNRLCITLGLRYEVGKSSSSASVRPTRGFRADYGFVSTLDDEIRRDPEREVGYGITDTWDEMLLGMPRAPATDETELGQRMTNFVTTIRQDTDEIYVRLDDAQDDRALISGWVNVLYRDIHDHARTARLMETEAKHSRQAWVQSLDTSDLARYEVMTLHTQVVAQHSEIGELRAKMAPKRTTRSTPATTTTTITTYVTEDQLKALIDQGIANALAALDADRSRNDEDSHDSRMGVRRQDPPAHKCTYQDFMKCKPLYFKGAKGVVELAQWLERMETMFHISNCIMENQIKFATCTLLGSALTKKMTDKYFPRGEIKKLKDKVERYVGGLSDVIHRSVVASRPKTMQEAIEMVIELMDGKGYKEKDKIRAKTRQNQEQTGSVEKSKVKPDKVKAQSKPKSIN
uniref:Reverse transcriptase domain-containing protein n=1 Tax=Tanacetum cinerariifolium TaxID=118510 RepID=A0A699H6X3_TANCI|nr:hypothetical protein [Tanacetum cinerariifolium]